jgi:hypothetical protein
MQGKWEFIKCVFFIFGNFVFFLWMFMMVEQLQEVRVKGNNVFYIWCLLIFFIFIDNRWFWLLNVQYICRDCRPFFCYLLYSVLDLCWRKDGRCSSVHNILMIFEWCSKVVVVKLFFVMWLWSLWCVRLFPIWTKNILTSDSLWFCLLTLCI